MAAGEAWLASQAYLCPSHVVQVQPRADQLSAAIRGAATAVKEKGVPAAEVGGCCDSQAARQRMADAQRCIYGPVAAFIPAGCKGDLVVKSAVGGAVPLSLPLSLQPTQAYL